MASARGRHHGALRPLAQDRQDTARVEGGTDRAATGTEPEAQGLHGSQLPADLAAADARQSARSVAAERTAYLVIRGVQLAAQDTLWGAEAAINNTCALLVRGCVQGMAGQEDADAGVV